MEKLLKKIKLLVIICLSIAVIETVFGFTTMYTGIMYKEFDTKNAVEMFDIIKSTDESYYKKLVNPTDDSYMKEFESFYTKRGNPVLIVLGVLIILFSIGSLVPITVIIVKIQDAGKEKGEDKEEKKGEIDEESAGPRGETSRPVD